MSAPDVCERPCCYIEFSKDGTPEPVYCQAHAMRRLEALRAGATTPDAGTLRVDPDEAQLIRQFNERARHNASVWSKPGRPVEPVLFDALPEDNRAYHLENERQQYGIVERARVGARLPEGPWKVVSPEDYAGQGNPYAKDWIVRSDDRPGHSAIVGSEAEAIAVRDALNRIAELKRE